MGSSSVRIGEEILWFDDALLEVWLRLAALHLADQTDDHSPIHTIRNEWLLASRGYFNGAVAHGLEENIATPEGRRSVLDSFRSLLVELERGPAQLDAGVLNLLGMSGRFGGPMAVARLMEVGRGLVGLMGGDGGRY